MFRNKIIYKFYLSFFISSLTVLSQNRCQIEIHNDRFYWCAELGCYWSIGKYNNQSESGGHKARPLTHKACRGIIWNGIHVVVHGNENLASPPISVVLRIPYPSADLHLLDYAHCIAVVITWQVYYIPLLLFYSPLFEWLWRVEMVSSVFQALVDKCEFKSIVNEIQTMFGD